MKRIVIVGCTLLALIGISIGYLVTRAPAVTVPFTMGVPTRFTPNVVYFCNSLTQNGGLQATIVKAESQGNPSPAQFTLKLIVQTSPDPITRAALVRLYKNELTGKPITHADIILVESKYVCAS